MKINVVDLLKKIKFHQTPGEGVKKVYKLSQSIFQKMSLFGRNFLNAISTLEMLYHFGSSNILISALSSFSQNQTAFREVQSETENRYFLFSIILLLTYSDSAQSSSRMAKSYAIIPNALRKFSECYLLAETVLLSSTLFDLLPWMNEVNWINFLLGKKIPSNHSYE